MPTKPSGTLTGEVLRLVREPNNYQDKLAVAVMKGENVVEHILYNL